MDYDEEIKKLEGQLKNIETAYIKCIVTIEYLKAQRDATKKEKKDK